jgi:hypothetical protein
LEPPCLQWRGWLSQAISAPTLENPIDMAIIDNVQKISDTIWEIAFHLQECASRKSSGAFEHRASSQHCRSSGEKIR